MRKLWKALVGILAAVAMLATGGLMATSASAADTAHTITITSDEVGHEYAAYQVFSGDHATVDNKETLSNIQWGAGVNGTDLLKALKDSDAFGENNLFASAESASNVADVMAKTEFTAAMADAFAKLANQNLTETVAGEAKTSTEANGKYKYVINVTGDGYYLVKDTKTVNDQEDMAATKIILKVVNNVEVNAKSDKPSIDKVIEQADSANGSNGKGTAVNVGDTVNFKLTSKVPDMDGYTSYDYIVKDTLSKGLTLVTDQEGKPAVTVTIGGTEYTDFTAESTTNGDDTTNLTITFKNFISQTKDAQIVIKYSATLNQNALNTDKESNTVHLEYSNNPNDSTSKGKTPEHKTYVHDFNVQIVKVKDGDETTKLSGAKFKLYKKGNGDTKLYYKWNEADGKVEWTDEASATEVETDVNGLASFEGLDSGTYYLAETAAPTGYNKLSGDVEVIITATYNEDGTIATSSAALTDNSQYIQSVTVKNKAGSQLPETGGMGTTVLYVAGAVIVIAAALGLTVVLRKRQNAR